EAAPKKKKKKSLSSTCTENVFKISLSPYVAAKEEGCAFISLLSGLIPPISLILVVYLVFSLQDVVVASGFTVEKSGSVHEDRLHPCKLLLSGDDACFYDSTKAKVPKYTYVGLDELEPGSVVNVYGVVVFFKQPFKSRGTDFCSILKITDKSNQKIGCTIFRQNLEDHPKIFQIGDIVRMHRVKAQFFNNAITLVNTFGFSVVTFDGVVGNAVEPRTSSRSFHFDQDDHRIVEELRSWAADGQTILPPTSTIPLSAVQPRAYFDLTCQLLSKAPIDTTCTLLKVWDGTRCPQTMLDVIVEPNVTEGPTSFSKEKEKLIANVLVYDNHVHVAGQLKPGDFLRIFNLRAILGSSQVPGLTSSQSEATDHLALHLHGGTAYGRGIRVLPENSPDVQKLKRTLDALSENNVDEFCELNDSELLRISITLPNSMELSELDFLVRCLHDVQPVNLAKVKQSDPGRIHHVRVQLRSYEPSRLYQSLKLYCSKCTLMEEIPDDELIAALFSDASKDSGPCSPPPWSLSGQVSVPGELLSEGKFKDLLFLMGSTLEEMCRLATGYQNIVPVRPAGGQLTLLDLSAPFLFRGRRRYYGCKRCSEASVKELSAKGVEAIDQKVVAEALGIQLLQFVLLMKLELQDESDTLDVLLWRDAEKFFGVTADDVAADQEAQSVIHRTMDTLCPPEGSAADRPWLDLCLQSYRAEDNKGRNRTCYQIVHTSVTKPASTPPDPGPT
uniref:Protection of telomeres protein 1 n=1 Tax=Echeneis naucrates TaxID=173247 RepID=A0A665U433_ECHNA